MSYRIDPKKRLARELHRLIDRGYVYAVINVRFDRVALSGEPLAKLRAYAGWTPNMALINIREHLAQLPQVSC